MDKPVSPLLDHCPEGLPVAAYLSGEWFAREQEAIWRREWVYAGRVADLAKGRLHRRDIVGASIIIAHAADGGLTAFHNSCRHRGAELCPGETAPLGRLISCPYHAWAYALDGRLVSTAFATPTEDFVKADHGLAPVALKVWNDLVFLCLADAPPPFAPDMGLAALDHWPMERLVTGHRIETVLACNWKVFWENYNECLHCPGIHAGLSQMVPIYQKGVMAPNELAGWQPGHDDPHLRPGARTWSLSGQTCGPDFAGLTEAERQAGHFFVTLYPTAFIVAHVDYVRVVSLAPLGPEETRLTAEWLFLPETMAAPGFDMADVVDFAAQVIAEDGAACEMNQRGLRSPAARTARLMPQEFDIYRFHNWVRARIGP